MDMPQNGNLRRLYSIIDENDTSEAEAEKLGWHNEGGLVAFFRKRFRKLDADGSNTVSISELMDHNVLQARTISDKLDVPLLLETTKYLYKGMHFGQDDGGLTEDEWVHYKLLRSSAPSWIAIEGVNRVIRRALKETDQQDLLSRLLSSFADGDSKGDGHVPKKSWPAVFTPLCESVAKSKELCEGADFNDDSFMDYYEFVARLFVGQKEEVELAMYDISNGMAKYVPAALLSGHKFEYIYHTGVVVFGKEFWYGGGVFASEPGTTPFGSPVKVKKLGFTLRTKSELLKYVTDHLRWQYNYANYDVLHHNCNCFSNDVVQFLMDGAQIPEEVRMQPRWAEDGMAVQALTPILNRWLGGFGQGNDEHGYCRIDDMTDVWRTRLREGDLVSWQRRFIDHPDIARIKKVDHVKNKASILIFSTLASESGPQEVHKNDVELQFLHPVPGHPTSNVLARDRAEAMPPSCPFGHCLEDPIRLILFKPLTCGVCNKTMERRIVCCTRLDEEDPRRCKKCKWDMCGTCVAEGRQMAGGHNGGVFSDVLTVPLAAELVQKPHWLRFKAYSYFYRADSDTTQVLESEELKHLEDRLCQELGIRYSSVSSPVGAMGFDLFIEFFKNILASAPQARKSRELGMLFD